MTPQGRIKGGRQQAAPGWSVGGRWAATAGEGQDLPDIPLRSATERMEEKNNPRARRLEEMLSGDKRHRAVSKQAGKLNWDVSPGAGSTHLSLKRSENTLPSSQGCDFQPRPALQKGDKLQNPRFGFCFLPTKDGKVAAGCLSTGVMPNHGLPSGDFPGSGMQEPGLPGRTGPWAPRRAASGCRLGC